LQAAVVAVASTGRFAEAAVLARDGGQTIREDERPQLIDLEISLWLRAGNTGQALSLAAAVCRESEGQESDTRCLAAANRLEGADRLDLALEVLGIRASERLAGNGLRAELVGRRLRAGDLDGAVKMTNAALTLSPTEGKLLSRLGQAFRDFGAGPTWANLLKKAVPVAGRRESEVASEMVFAAMSTGDEIGASEAMEFFLKTRRGVVGAAYMEWVRSGRRDLAQQLLARVSDESLAGIDASDLAEVAEDLARIGRDDLMDNLLDRYLRGNEGIAAANENIGRVFASLGRFDRAVESLSKVPANSLTSGGRSALMSALWRMGKRKEALSAALAGLDGGRGNGKAADEHPWPRVGLAFFLSEGALGESIAFLDRAISGPDVPLQLIRARLRLRTDASDELVKARKEFLETLPLMDKANDDAFHYVRDEVRAGRGDDLVGDLGAIRGKRAAEARMLAACLIGRKDLVEEARSGLIGGGPPGHESLLAAARAAFECGRWEDAGSLAERVLKAAPRDIDISDALQMTLVSGRMLKRNPVKAVEVFLASRTEDPSAVLAAQGIARWQSGDYAGQARALLERSRWFPLDPAAAMDAVEAALNAGDEAAANKGEVLVLAAADDRPLARRRLADLYTRRLRDDLAARILESALSIAPADEPIAGRRLVALLRSGDASAKNGARDYVARHAARRKVAAAVVSAAAVELATEVVQDWIPTLLDGGRDAECSNALWQAARMAFRLGLTKDAETWARASAALATDGSGLLVRVTQEVLVDPELPFSIVDLVRGALDPGPGKFKSPSELALECGEAVDAPAAAVCARKATDSFMPVSGLLAALGRAMVGGRFDAARVLAEAAANAYGTSTSARRAIAARLLGFLGDASISRNSSRQSMGAMALKWVETDAIPRDADGVALRGHLTEMALGLPAGIATYQREINLSPSDGSLRNNLAYLLSMAGGDLELAQGEARNAEILAPRGAPYYLETEAWARFLYKGAKTALPLQEKARSAWTVEQGGGVSEGFYHLGRMLEAGGRPSNAREAYRKAAILEPSDWSGIRALRRFREMAPQ
jgi:tetratricopeptide (TPR) repeat protein